MRRRGQWRERRGRYAAPDRTLEEIMPEVEGGTMNSVRPTIPRFRENRRTVMLVAAVVWGLLMPLTYLALAAEPLKVGGLPVT
jgi:hypothetical protein